MAATEPRLTVISGAFGTGKTEIAINLALELRAQTQGPVTLVDLDIVNLYFRSRQKAATNSSSWAFASFRASRGWRTPTCRRSRRRSTPVSTGRTAPSSSTSAEAIWAAWWRPICTTGSRQSASRHWLVVNPYRPFNQTAEATVDMARRIEVRSRLPIMRMIANPHLIAETTPAIIREGFAKVLEVTQYPLVCLAVMAEFYTPGEFDDLGVPVMLIRKQMKQPWEPGGIMMAGKEGKKRCP